MSKRCIYKIINVKNGKFYIGSAVNFTKRKAKHKWRLNRGDHSNKHLQAAWDKYGAKSFVFAVLHEVPPEEDLLEAENRYLHEHVGKDYCYNIAKDATAFGLGKHGELNPMFGKHFTHTEEAKAKIAAAGKGRKRSAEAIAKTAAALRGRAMPTETREKISNTLKGEGNFWYGKKRPEFAEKIRKAVYCPTNGVTYPSVRHAREELGIQPTTINRALKSGQPISRGPFYQWEFHYASSIEETSRSNGCSPVRKIK